MAVTSFVIFILLQGLAGAADRVTLVAERSMPGGKEQIGLSIGTSEARLTLNSNFVDDLPRHEVELGLFVSALTPELSAERQLLEADFMRIAATRRPKEIGAPLKPESPHDTVWMLNGKLIEEGSVYLPGARSLLRRAPLIAKWTPKDVVRIRIGANGTPELQRLAGNGKAAEAPKCSPRTAMNGSSLGFRCEVPGYGVAYLAPL